MTSNQLKILVSGDVEGNFDRLFSRINSIQKKSGNFDLLICVGDFFGKDKSQWDPYRSGQSKVPIPTLVLGPNHTEHVEFFDDMEGCDLCPNVTYLVCQLERAWVSGERCAPWGSCLTFPNTAGKRGRFKGSSGLSLAYLSGVESSESKSSDTTFGDQDVSHLVLPVSTDTKFKGVDILITSQWPDGVEKYGSDISVPSTPTRSSAISQLALRLRPRYHFCGMMDTFYERQPYRNHKVLAEKERHVTRFIGLAKVSNTQKKKYLYAFSITPLSEMEESDLTRQPDDVTECPYKISAISSKQDGSKNEQQFFYDMKSGDEKGKKRQREDGDRRPPKKHPQPSGPCWFCLGSPEVEKHLVVSVGTQVYLALAKGGLVDDHTLILPIGHHQSTVLAPGEVREEIEQYKAALKKYFKQQDKSVIFFERNYKTQHLQIQAVPIPTDCIQEVKDTFMECAEAESFELHEIPKHSDLKQEIGNKIMNPESFTLTALAKIFQIVPPGAPYFYAELPTGDKLLHRISKNFPLQFGREVLACPQILNMPERVDWKACKISKDQESDNAKYFRTTFEPFDFNN